MASTSQAAAPSAGRPVLQQGADRLLEAAPGLITWTLLLAPAWIPALFGSDGAYFVGLAVLAQVILGTPLFVGL